MFPVLAALSGSELRRPGRAEKGMSHPRAGMDPGVWERSGEARPGCWGEPPAPRLC